VGSVGPGLGWRNPLEGASFNRLTDFEGDEDDAVLSPDGNFVSFLSDRDGTHDVWVLQIASGQFLNLTKGKFPTSSTRNSACWDLRRTTRRSR